MTTFVEQEQAQQQPQTAIDKAIASHDIKALFSEPCLKELAEMDRANYFATEQRIKSAFKKDVNLNELRKAVKEQRESLKPWADDGNKKAAVSRVAGVWAANNASTWAFDEKHQVWRKWNGKWWEEQESTGKLDLEAERILSEFGVDINGVGTLNAFHRFAVAHLPRKFSESQKINFTNGTLVVEGESVKFRAHEREDELTSCLPYPYDKSGKHPNIDAYLAGAIPDEMGRKAYMAHVGLSLIKDRLMHTGMILIGPRRSGKSTALALCNAICGIKEPWSFAGASLFGRDLEGKRSRYKWNKKPVVCVDELPAEALREEEMLKRMLAHSGTEERGINRDEEDDNRWLPKVVLATNDTPQLKDNSGALKERLIVVTFPNERQPEQQDRTLFIKKLLPEIGTFAATCIHEALSTLHSGVYPTSKQMKKALDKIATTGNPLKEFLSEWTAFDPQAQVSNDRLHTAYAEECRKNGNRPFAKNAMCRAIIDMHLPGIECGISMREKKGALLLNGKVAQPAKEVVTHGIKGLRLLSEEERAKKMEEEELAEEDL